MANELTIEINADDSGLQDGLSEVKQNLAIVSQGLMEMGANIKEAFMDALDGVFETEKGLLKFQNQTGTSTSEMKKYGQEIKDLYKSGIGESIDDVSAAMANVQQQSKQLGVSSPKDLKNITEQAMILRDNFEVDIPEATKTAGNLMKNFGLTSQESLDFIAKGFQDGLNQSDDLMDTLYEYSPQFAKIGLGATDMFAILKKGSESGIFTLDKVGDSIKEFGIRVIDGSTGTKDAMKSIGLNADDMAKKFTKGGKDANDAFYATIEGLSKIKDPVVQNAAGVALFGTMWEDLGAKTVLSFGKIDKAAVTYKGTMDNIKKNTSTQDISKEFESLKRTIEIDLVQPIAEKLLPALKSIGDMAKENLPKLKSAFDSIPTSVITASVAFAGLATVFTSLAGLYGMLAPAVEAIKAGFIAISGVVAGLTAPIWLAIAGFAAWLAIIYIFRDEIANAFNKIVSVVLPVLTAISNYLTTTFTTYIMPIINEQLPKIQSAFMNAFESIKGHLSTVIPFVIALITGMKPVFDFIVYALQGLWTGFLIVFGNIISFVGSTISNIIQFIQGFITILIGVVNIGLGILSGDWSRIWEGIKMVVIGAFNMVASIIRQAIDVIKLTIGSGLEIVLGIFNRIFPGIGEVVRNIWNVIKQIFVDGATNIKNTLSSALQSLPDTISSMGTNIWNAGGKLIDQLIGGIKSGLTRLKNACADVGQTISNFFPHSPAKEGALRTFPKVGYTLMQQLMEGIQAGNDKVQSITANVASNIASNINANVNLATSNSSNNVTIPIYLDGRKISEVTAPYLVRALREQGF